MKKILIASSLLMIILFQSGCSPKTEYIYIPPKPYKFQMIEQPKAREIRVYKQDETLYRAYIQNFRDIIDFNNNQIRDYFENFDLNITKDSNATKQKYKSS